MGAPARCISSASQRAPVARKSFRRTRHLEASLLQLSETRTRRRSTPARSITPTSQVPAQRLPVCVRPRQRQHEPSDALPHPSRLRRHVKYERWKLAVARDGYRSVLAAERNLQFRTKYGHGLAFRRDSRQLRLQWILHRMRGILQHHFRISGNSGGDRLYQWWNERHRRRQREYVGTCLQSLLLDAEHGNLHQRQRDEQQRRMRGPDNTIGVAIT